jgi:mono/diheme cytochrome c family protein
MKRLSLVLVLIGSSLQLPSPLFAAPEHGWDPDTTFPALSPAEAIKTIEVPKGYRLQCIASEPLVEEPVNFAYDGDGSMYVCEWRTYMQDEYATNQMDPVSRVVKLRDTNGDGVMDQRTVFIDNVVLPRSILPLQDRVLVVLTGSSSVWAYFDDNNDGVSDRRELVFEGTDITSNIEHQSSGLLWNLDNTVCTNDSRFAYRDGKLISQKHAVGRISQWGLTHDDDGRLYGTLAGGANPAFNFQLPAGYPIVSIKEHADGYRVPYPICKVWDQSSGRYDEVNQHILTDFSACCGQAMLRSPLFPEFYGTMTTCEPVGRLIRLSKFSWKDGHGVAENAFPKSEFIRSTDAYFRPVWSLNAPDGSLVIADMYRGIIQEKTWFPTEETDTPKDWVARYHRVKKWGMVEVVRHGRLYRLIPESAKPGPQPHMLDESSEALVAHLSNPNGWWRDTAQMLIVSRGDKSAVPALLQTARTQTDTNARIHALWCLKGLEALPDDLVMASLQNEQARVRRVAVQLAEPSLKQAQVTEALLKLVDDPDPTVRIQLFLAFRANKEPAPAALTEHPNPIITALQNREKDEAQRAMLGHSAKQGRQIYESICTTCHGPDGKGGKQGENMLAPSLVQNELFKNGRVDLLARVLLKGESGPIGGVSYGEGFMPPWEAAFNDEQMASVLNFVGESWYRWRKPMATAQKIAEERKRFVSKTTAWTSEEIQASLKKTNPQ